MLKNFLKVPILKGQILDDSVYITCQQWLQRCVGRCEQQREHQSRGLDDGRCWSREQNPLLGSLESARLIKMHDKRSQQRDSKQM